MENIRYLFSDHFAHRENWLTCTETRVKMFYVFGGLILNICASGMLAPLLLFFINIGLLLSIKTPIKTLSLRMLLPLFFAIFILMIKGLHEGQTPVFSVSPLGYDLILRREGLQAGCLIFFKVMGGISLILLLSFTTTIADLCAGARWLRIPEVLLELLFLMYRYIFLFLEEVSRVRTAQRCRLGYSTWRKTIHSFGTLGGMLMVRTISRAESTHTAMRSRGYDGGSILTANVAPLKRNDYVILGGLIAFLSAFGLINLI
ncbi:MAG TPA: cobalt ECF transporter T component CbiQ [Candidatus Brocadiia bacterium]|nr:cobalt ECF transporter T component CbiQ [Planctomycetota bacterium]MDO8093400.1 cobalt ECF transporter T component CbiQ [Candidatus Brocadiales bacterium]